MKRKNACLCFFSFLPPLLFFCFFPCFNSFFPHFPQFLVSHFFALLPSSLMLFFTAQSSSAVISFTPTPSVSSPLIYFYKVFFSSYLLSSLFNAFSYSFFSCFFSRQLSHCLASFSVALLHFFSSTSIFANRNCSYTHTHTFKSAER